MEKKKFKKVFSKVFVTAVLGFILYGPSVNAEPIRESVGNGIDNGTYIIGITRFTPDQVLTGVRISKATINDMIYHENVPDYEGANIYYFLFGTWYRLDEYNNYNEVTDSTELASLNNRDIYYVNNVEKTIGLNYRQTVGNSVLSYNTIPEKKARNITFSNGVLQIPSTVSSLKVLENDNEIQRYTRVDTNADSTYNPSILGSIARDDNSIGGNLTENITDNNLTLSGEVAWYGANATRDTAGNRFGFKVNTPAGFAQADLNNTKVRINGKEYAWSDLITDETSFTWIQMVDEIDTTNGNVYDVVVTWKEGVEESFKVVLDAASTLAPDELGSISAVSGVLNGSTLVITGEVAWNGKKEITLTAPNGYDNSKLADTKVIFGGKEYSWNELSASTTATITPLLKEQNVQTVKIVWNEENIQEFTIDATGVTYAGMPKGTIEDADDNATSVIDGNTILFTGQNIVYNVFAGDKGGNQIKVGFDNPSYDYTTDTFSVIVNDYLGETRVDGLNKMNNIVPITFREDFRSATVTVIWEEGNTQDFVVKVGDRTTFMAEPTGTFNIDFDSPYSGKPNGASFTLSKPSKNEIYATGTVAYYHADGKVVAGNRMAVAITPNDYYKDKLDKVTVKYVNDEGQEVIEKWGDGETYTFAPKITWDKMTSSIEVTWDVEGSKRFTQTFIVGITEIATLVQPPKAGITKVENDNYTTVIDDNDITITGTIPYFSQDGEIKAGNKVPLSLDPGLTGYDETVIANAKVVETIGSKETFNGTWSAFNKSNDTWWIYFDDEKTAKLEITWEEGNVQTITVDATGSNLVEAPHAIVTGRESDKYTTTINGNKVIIDGFVPYVTENGTTGNVVYIKIDPSAMTAYTEDEINASEVSLKVGNTEAQSITWGDFVILNEGAWLIPFTPEAKEATISITWEKGNTQTIEISIAENAILEVKATDVQVADSSVDVLVGGTYQIDTTVTPSTATNTMSYIATVESEDGVDVPTDAVSVDETGLVTVNKYSKNPIKITITIDEVSTTMTVNTVFEELAIGDVTLESDSLVISGKKYTIVTPTIKGGSGSFSLLLLEGINSYPSTDGKTINIEGPRVDTTYILRVVDEVTGLSTDKEILIPGIETVEVA